jgi:hypothetical protein
MDVTASVLAGAAVGLPLALAGDVLVMRVMGRMPRRPGEGRMPHLDAWSLVLPLGVRTVLSVAALFLVYLIFRSGLALISALASILLVRGVSLAVMFGRGRGRR